MSSSDERRERRAEELVGEHLLRRRSAIDGAALLARVQHRLATEPSDPELPRPTPKPRRWLAIAGSLIVASLLLTLWIMGTGPGSAAAAVREILHAHRLPVDRVYEVSFEPNAESPLLLRFVARHSARLTTAGDRFVVEPETDGRWLVWGSEGVDTGLWAAVPGQFGIRVSSEETRNRVLERIADLRTLDLQRVLESLDLDFELELEERADGRQALVGTPRPGSVRPSSGVRLHTRPDSKVVEELAIDLSRDGRPVGTLTFKWQEDVEPRDARYRLTSFLDPSNPVIDRTGLPLLSALQELAERLRGE